MQTQTNGVRQCCISGLLKCHFQLFSSLPLFVKREVDTVFTLFRKSTYKWLLSYGFGIAAMLDS